MSIARLTASVLFVGIVSIDPALANSRLDRVRNFVEAKGFALVLLTQAGCQSDRQLPMGVALKGRRVTGVVFAASRGNPPDLRGKPHYFDIPVRPDGTFGGIDDKYRFWLRGHSSGDAKYQWVAGRVSASRIAIQLTFGSPGRPGSYCTASGSAAR